MREIPIFKNDFNIRIRRANHNDLGSLTNFLTITVLSTSLSTHYQYREMLTSKDLNRRIATDRLSHELHRFHKSISIMMQKRIE